MIIIIVIVIHQHCHLQLTDVHKSGKITNEGKWENQLCPRVIYAIAKFTPLTKRKGDFYTLCIIQRVKKTYPVEWHIPTKYLGVAFPPWDFLLLILLLPKVVHLPQPEVFPFEEILNPSHTDTCTSQRGYKKLSNKQR